MLRHEILGQQAIVGINNILLRLRFHGCQESMVEGSNFVGLVVEVVDSFVVFTKKAV